MIMTWWMYVLFLGTGALAGLVDSIAGGGGLITLPVALAFGMPPKIALGTNKFQASFGSFTAAYYYIRHRVVDLRAMRGGIFFTFLGAAAGTWAVQHVGSDLLGRIIPFFLVAIVIYTVVTPRFGELDSKPRLPFNFFFAGAGLALGFYDGFFGPGVGSFWAIAIMLGVGMNLMKSTGATKVMNFTSNIVSLALFLAAGYVWFAPGISMALGQVIGARLGSAMAVRRGAAIIRPIYIAIVLATTLKLLYNLYAH